MKKIKFLFFCLLIESFLIVSISLANYFGKPIFYLFYNVVYGLILSTMIPVLYISKYKENIFTLGIRKLRIKQVFIIMVFVLFSIGGQFIQITTNKTIIDLSLLKICFLPLVMTTFFEEFLFRGFMQTRFEKHFGSIFAIIASGLMFSIYHIGYPGFRDVSMLLLLFAVGIGFSLSYKLSDNNLVVSYFVNLPNAFLTYILNSSKFPKFDYFTSIFAGITILIVIMILIYIFRKFPNKEL